MVMKRGQARWLLVSAALLSGCGAPDISGPRGGGSSKTDDASGETAPEDSAAFDELVMPPQEYYDALFQQALALADSPSAAPQGPEVLWINFDGATVNKGFGAGQSFIPCKSVSTIPAPSLSAADKDNVVALVQQFYSATNANLVVTPSKPAVGEFTTIHVGGSYRDLGCAGSGVLGIAPLDGGNANRSDIGFAFTPSYATAKLIAETVAHEAGHSYGLDHVVKQTDLMYFSAGNNIDGFGISKVEGSGRIQDEPAILRKVLGESTGGVVVVPPSTPTTPSTPSTPATPSTPTTPVAGLPNLPIDLADLPGLIQLGNLGKLLPTLAGGNLADITQLLPQLQALIPTATNGSFPGLDQILTIVGTATQAGTTNNQGGVVGTSTPINPALAGIILGAVTGAPLDITQLGGLLGGLFGNKNGGSTPTLPPLPAITSLPDLTQLLGINTAVTDLPTLITNFVDSLKVVNANFTGADRDALISLLKVAYAQQFARLAP